MTTIIEEIQGIVSEFTIEELEDLQAFVADRIEAKKIAEERLSEILDFVHSDEECEEEVVEEEVVEETPMTQPKQQLVDQLEIKEVGDDTYVTFGKPTSYLLTEFGKWMGQSEVQSYLMDFNCDGLKFYFNEHGLRLHYQIALNFAEFLGNDVEVYLTDILT